MSIRLGTQLLAGTPSALDIVNTNITNCITHIPQDIKLELNAGTFTLKAGSKVYVPNGFEQDGVTRKFDIVTISSDLTIQSGSGWAQDNYMIFYDADSSSLNQGCFSNMSSGTTEPVDKRDRVWYDTTNNIIKRFDNPGTSYDKVSLPICICTNPTGSLFESLIQVFYGFGYIGSTVFALPGVKGLIPNGRNADGTLKNTEITISSVLTTTFTATEQSTNLALKQNELQYHTFIYDEKTNFNDVKDWMNAGTLKLTAGVVSDFSPKTVFHSLDYNDRAIITGWSRPSSNMYIGLSLGASGAAYTATDNGYFFLDGVTTAQGGSVYIMANNMTIGDQNYLVSGPIWLIMPVKKGDSATIVYDSFTAYNFKFIYAQGEV